MLFRSLEVCDGGKDHAQFTRRIPNRVEIAAKLNCRGMLNVNDVYFPGWTATVDGRPAKVYETYGVIRGVVVEGGSHRVELRYRPWSVIAGAAISAFGLIAAVIVCSRSRF